MMPTYPGQPTYGNYDYGNPNPYLGAYRNYGNYNPYNSIPNNQTQPMAPQTAPMAVPQQTNNNIQFFLVPSREVAEQAIAEKGQTIYMLNQNFPEIYAKSADNFGLQTMKYCRMSEFNPKEEQQTQQPNVNADYIPRSEFNQFVAAVSAEIENLKNTPVQPVTQQTVTKPNNSSNKKPPVKDDKND